MGEVEEGEGDNRQQRVWEYDDMVAIREGQATKSDDFSEKFQTAFDPPPPHFRKIILQNFYDRYGCIQGCKIRSILPSGMGARGVSSEHVENMEMFWCALIL